MISITMDTAKMCDQIIDQRWPIPGAFRSGGGGGGAPRPAAPGGEPGGVHAEEA